MLADEPDADGLRSRNLNLSRRLSESRKLRNRGPMAGSRYKYTARRLPLRLRSAAQVRIPGRRHDFFGVAGKVVAMGKTLEGAETPASVSLRKGQEKYPVREPV